VTEAIPKLIEWAKSIEAQDARSPVRREKQSFTFSYSLWAKLDPQRQTSTEISQ